MPQIGPGLVGNGKVMLGPFLPNASVLGMEARGSSGCFGLADTEIGLNPRSADGLGGGLGATGFGPKKKRRVRWTPRYARRSRPGHNEA